MARGLPCLASDLAGCAELLSPPFLVEGNQIEIWANRLVELLSDPEYLARASRCNLEIAANYTTDVVRERRLRFYEIVGSLK